MGLQLIFVVETNKKCKSDWIYIKETIDHFYQYSNTQVKLTPVYMDGKGKYKSKEKEISSLISQYASTSKTNQSKVIFCFDCDDYDVKPEDATFLKNAQQYCAAARYDFVWFCKDIEHVYIGERVADRQKKTESVRFISKKLINIVSESQLTANRYQVKKSNIMTVLDQHLTRKD